MDENPYKASRPVMEELTQVKGRRTSSRSWKWTFICLAFAWILPIGGVGLTLISPRLDRIASGGILGLCAFSMLVASMVLVTVASILSPKHGAMILLGGVAGIVFELTAGSSLSILLH
ncbi:MAG: hypothetical protein U0894_04810 [Pirellulales bacterium]